MARAETDSGYNPTGPDEIRPTAVAGVRRRPVQERDMDFLHRVYASARADEMAMIVDWSEEQKESFLRQQCLAQHTYYRAHYPRASFDILVQEDTDIGRLYVDRLDREIRIMEITLLPPYRNRGIGGALVREIMEEAGQTARIVSLHVEEYNPAKRLYGRLGFFVAGSVTFYQLMQWEPDGVVRPVIESEQARSK